MLLYRVSYPVVPVKKLFCSGATYDLSRRPLIVRGRLLFLLQVLLLLGVLHFHLRGLLLVNLLCLLFADVVRVLLR